MLKHCQYERYPNTVSYAVFEIVVRPDIHPESFVPQEAKPGGIRMTEGGYSGNI